MKRFLVAAVALALALLPSSALANPPAADPQNACVVPGVDPRAPDHPVPVIGTLSYLAPLGTSLPCATATSGAATNEWGSRAAPCPAAIGPVPAGPTPGAYCGPLVPPGGYATCTWEPISDSVPTALVIAFDGYLPGGVAGSDGVVSFTTTGGTESLAYGPVSASQGTTGWSVRNPYPVAARVIAYPTALSPFPPGTTAANDVNLVVCTTPPAPPAHITIHRFASAGTFLLAAPVGWSCTDDNSGAAVAAGSALTLPNPGVTCTPPGGASTPCTSVDAGGYHAAAGGGTLVVTSTCGALSASKSMTLPFFAGVSLSASGAGTFPWSCRADEGGLIVPPAPDYWVFCDADVR